ncbi:MAG: hypothetical protein ACRYF3_09275, partial [Janthinobacterium lividum]
VSKGGLLYHFGSKDALVEGLLARLRTLSALDLGKMRSAPEGAVRYYVRTSVMEGDALSRNLIAVLRLAQERDARAVEAYAGVGEQWREAIEEEVGDPVLSRIVQLVGDGLWSASALGIVSGGPSADVEAVVARVAQLVADSSVELADSADVVRHTVGPPHQGSATKGRA